MRNAFPRLIARLHTALLKYDSGVRRRTRARNGAAVPVPGDAGDLYIYCSAARQYWPQLARNRGQVWSIRAAMSHFSSLATLLVVVVILVVIRSEPIKEGRCVLREQRAAPLPPVGELLHQTLAGLEIAIHLHKVFRARREHLARLSVVVLAPGWSNAATDKRFSGASDSPPGGTTGICPGANRAAVSATASSDTAKTTVFVLCCCTF